MTALILVAAGLLCSPARAQTFADAHEQVGNITETVKEAKDFGRRVSARRDIPWLTVRFPTWELAAIHSGEFMIDALTPLTTGEMTDAQFVFQDAVDLSKVRVGYSAFCPLKMAQTWGNIIRFKTGTAFSHADLMHELTHVWQYQTRGSAYISDSAYHNAKAGLFEGGMEQAYKYKIVPGKDLLDYTAEQQAQIVEDFFSTQTLRTDAAYLRLIEQLRSIKALKGGGEVLFEEQAAGLPPRQYDVGPPTRFGAETGNVPLLEFRFPGL